jgi:hypothetical protein
MSILIEADTPAEVLEAVRDVLRDQAHRLRLRASGERNARRCERDNDTASALEVTGFMLVDATVVPKKTKE